MFDFSVVPVKIFQFQDMGNENRFLGTFRGHGKRPIYVNIKLNVFFKQKNSDPHLHQFVVHASLDLVDEMMWSTNNM